MPRKRGPNATVAWLAAPEGREGVAGAAFLYDQRTAITCAHVVRDHLALGDTTPEARPDGVLRLRFEAIRDEVEATVAPCGWFPDGTGEELEDIAILTLSRPVDLRPVGLAGTLPTGTSRCYAYGQLAGYTAIGQTVHADLHGNANGRGWHQLDAVPGGGKGYFIQRGFSGAPVFDPLGNTVWGMIAAVDDLAQSGQRLVAFAIPADPLYDALIAARRCATGGEAADAQPERRRDGPLDALARTALVAAQERAPAPPSGDVRAAEGVPVEEDLRDAVAALAAAGAGEDGGGEADRARGALEALAEGDPGPAADFFQHPAPAPAPTPAPAMSLGRLALGLAAGLMRFFGSPKQGTASKAGPGARAEDARRRGALLRLSNVKDALEAYREAAALDPADVWTWINIATLAQQTGTLALAGQATAKAFELAASMAGDGDLGRLRNLAVSHGSIGDVKVAQGDLPGALAAFEEAMAISRRLAQSDPGNAEWQRDLSVSHNRIGEVKVARGDLDGALAAFEDGMSISRRLAQTDPANDGWQRDLAVSHNRIGEVKVARGDLDGALAAFEDGMSISRRLAQTDPGNAEWQRDLSVSHNKIGDAKVAQGDLPGALAAIEDAMAIRRRLAQTDPGNAEWQRDLSVSHNKIGDAKVAQGDLPGALAAIEDAMAIRRRLAQTDPGNAGWQRDLSVSHNKIGEVKLARGDIDGALAAFEEGMAIARRLAETDPGNAGWQRDLSISHNKIGDVKLARGDFDGALAAFEEDMAISRRLAQADPGNAGWQRDLSISHNRIGEVKLARGDRDGARREIEAARAIVLNLLERFPDHQQWRQDLAHYEDRLKRLEG